MSMEICYFSGTGNSLHVAQELQKRFPKATLLPMVKLLNKDAIIVTRFSIIVPNRRFLWALYINKKTEDTIIQKFR